MAMFLNTPLPYKRYKKISETTYFVDKSLILNDIFGCMEEETQYICITRPRRFGKTIMANMLGAFFGKAWDASQIFDRLKIAASPEYHQYLNQYDIIYIDFSRLPENCTSYNSEPMQLIINLEILDLLNTLFSLSISPETKTARLQEDFGIAMTEEFESKVQDMCNLGKALVKQGIVKGMEQGVEQKICPLQK